MTNILITGAANGIGYYLVKELLTQGRNVTVLDLDVGPLADLSGEYASLLPMVCDVRDLRRMKECVKESAEKFGSVDCAVHNACLCTFGSMEQTTEETYHDVMEVNYFGALHLAREVIPYMKSQGGGKIIFTSSGVGVMGFVNISPYAASKGAIESLAKCLNIEYREDGIRFHIFHPPLTRTRSSEPLPVPPEFMADPEKVGVGLARNMEKKSFVICHSLGQRVQTAATYLFPLKLGKLMSKMTASYESGKQKE